MVLLRPLAPAFQDAARGCGALILAMLVYLTSVCKHTNKRKREHANKIKRGKHILVGIIVLGIIHIISIIVDIIVGIIGTLKCIIFIMVGVIVGIIGIVGIAIGVIVGIMLGIVCIVGTYKCM